MEAMNLFGGQLDAEMKGTIGTVGTVDAHAVSVCERSNYMIPL
jgi:hypothetical protein